ncbi:MAG: SPOR domain-containing protein [Rhizobiaceae bacterium]|nr:SPOR domain-containing protein [Rhizobiaceae bacterium]
MTITGSGSVRSWVAAIIMTGVTALSPTVAAAAEWYVVVGSFRETSSNAMQSADALMASVNRGCGGDIQWDYSVKFYNFQPGYLVVFSGPYGSKSRAERMLAQVRPCAPDAYVKSSRYAGE